MIAGPEELWADVAEPTKRSRAKELPYLDARGIALVGRSPEPEEGRPEDEARRATEDEHRPGLD